MTVLSAAIKAIPDDIVEAARLDGVGGMRMFRYITVPSIRPALIVVLTTITIATLKVFDIVRTMTGGNFNTSVVANEFYTQSFRAGQPGSRRRARRRCCSSSSSRSSSTTSVRCASWRHDDHRDPRRSRRTATVAGARGRRARTRRLDLAVGVARGDHHRHPLDDPDLRPVRHLVPARGRTSRRSGWWTCLHQPERSPWRTTTTVLARQRRRDLGDLLRQLDRHHDPGGAHPDHARHARGLRVRLDRSSRAATSCSSRSSRCRSCRSRSR